MMPDTSVATVVAVLMRAFVLCTFVGDLPAHADDAESLKACHAALREQLATNQFLRPLYLASAQSKENILGDVYAVLGQPFVVVGAALQDVARWCDFLILHPNVKACRALNAGTGESLSLNIGRKYEQPIGDTYRLEFNYRPAAAAVDYLSVALQADDGPLGTSRYRIALEVVALDQERSFLHLSYSYDFDGIASAAMQGYLLTLGRGKAGFTILGHKPNGKPMYIGGARAVIERNTMRYYLAIEAYLGALSVAEPERREKRINDWYAGAERYPQQLHDLERAEYLQMKRREIARQIAPAGED